MLNSITAPALLLKGGACPALRVRSCASLQSWTRAVPYGYGKVSIFQMAQTLLDPTRVLLISKPRVWKRTHIQ